MFQFTTRTIINSSLDSNGSLAKYSGDTNSFTVTRVNKFYQNKIEDSTIYKRVGVAGTKEVATVTVPSATAGDVIRVTFGIRESDANTAQYVNSMSYKTLPISAEVLYTTDAATTAGLLAAAINKIKSRFGQSIVVASTSGANLIITAVDSTQRFKNYKLSKAYNDTVYNIVGVSYTDIATGSVTTPGVNEFGTANYLTYNNSLPTWENTRWTALNQEEKPVPGALYTEYVLRYAVRNNFGGGVYNGINTSITTHVFYVKSDLVSAFEAAITGAGITISTISAGGTFAVSVTDNKISIASGDTAELSTTYAKGVVTYAQTAGAGTVTIANDTITPTGAGSVTITATDTFTGGTQTATVTITVVA